MRLGGYTVKLCKKEILPMTAESFSGWGFSIFHGHMKILRLVTMQILI